MTEQAWNDPNYYYLADVEALALAKYTNENYYSAFLKVKQGMKEGEKIHAEVNTVLTRDQFRNRLEADLSAVKWKPKNPGHHAKVKRPGISKYHQRELEEVTR